MVASYLKRHETGINLLVKLLVRKPISILPKMSKKYSPPLVCMLLKGIQYNYRASYETVRIIDSFYWSGLFIFHKCTKVHWALTPVQSKETKHSVAFLSLSSYSNGSQWNTVAQSTYDLIKNLNEVGMVAFPFNKLSSIANCSLFLPTVFSDPQAEF